MITDYNVTDYITEYYEIIHEEEYKEVEDEE